MKKIIKFLIIFLFISQYVSSQNFSDALRLSYNQINGTARASAMGNAFGSLGGDFTSLSINPAGIGVYRSNEIVITPSINFNKSKLSFNNSYFNDNGYKLDLNNIGLVGTINFKKNTGVVNFNWGIGMNKILDFNQNSFVKNNGSPISFIDDIVYWANSEGLSNDYLNRDFKNVEIRDWPTKLAWDTYLFDPALDNKGNEIDGKYVAILYPNELVNQRKSFEQRGGINEFIVSGGLNLNYKLYIGATLGMNNVNLNQLTSYSEDFGGNSFTFSDDYSLTGNGANLKFGVIYKPINILRLGVAFHTPTYYNLTQTNIYSNESKLLENHYSEGTNIYEYEFTTPSKTILSGALIFGKSMLISGDVEFQDYTTMKFINTNLSDLNLEINDKFKNTISLRFGGEYKITPKFSLRGGYELYQNPYDGSLNEYQPVLINNTNIFAGGIGYNTTGKRLNFFTDITYRRLISNYKLNEIQPNFENIDLKNSMNKILFTMGFKF